MYISTAIYRMKNVSLDALQYRWQEPRCLAMKVAGV